MQQRVHIPLPRWNDCISRAREAQTEKRNEKNGSEKMKLRILNDTGHTDLEVTQREAIEQINDHPTHWVFINGEMVSREEVNSLNWDAVESVDLSPAIVGGY